MNDDNSDAESVDSELDNPLKHAGTYSAEEVVRIMREKLIRLQKLYIDQFQRLRYSTDFFVVILIHTSYMASRHSRQS